MLPTGINVDDLSEDGKKIVMCLVTYFDSLLKDKQSDIDAMATRVDFLESRIQKFEETIDDAAAFEKRDTLILSGNIPKVTTDENCKQIVVNLLKNRTKFVISKDDISVSHRIGAKPRRQGADVRKILFKLVRRDLKTDILNACKSAKPDFYVNESLTPVRDRIYFHLRKITKDNPAVIHHCKTFDGNVTVFLQPVNNTRGISRLPKIVVNTRSQLKEFLRRTITKTFEDLHIDWPET